MTIDSAPLVFLPCCTGLSSFRRGRPHAEPAVSSDGRRDERPGLAPRIHQLLSAGACDGSAAVQLTVLLRDGKWKYCNITPNPHELYNRSIRTSPRSSIKQCRRIATAIRFLLAVEIDGAFAIFYCCSR